MNARWTLLLLSTIALAPAVANAQGGCVNSPENGTVILALVGVGGALSSNQLKSWWRRR